MTAPAVHAKMAVGRPKPTLSLLTFPILIFTLLVFLCSIADAAPTRSKPVLPDDVSRNEASIQNLWGRQEASGDFYLRIMPLGASITKGSSDDPELKGRGYRKFLRDTLRSRGWRVNMVGSQRNGEFNDNDTEGWPGFVIGSEDGEPAPEGQRGSVHNKARDAVAKYKPNLVLLNVGTNDAGENNDLDNAGKRMEALVRTVFDKSPDVVVVLSTLIPSKDSDDKVEYINTQFRGVVAKLSAEKNKIVLADMHDGFITKDQLVSDGIHPTAEGALNMASVWHSAILEVERRGDWLKEPSSDVDFEDDAAGSQTCDKEFKSGASDPRSGMQVLYAKSGNIRDDGNYIHSSEEQGKIAAVGRLLTSVVHAAQLVTQGADRGGERDELVEWTDGGSLGAWPVQKGIFMWENTGNGQFKDPVWVQGIDTNCESAGIRWGDLNNDGLDDLICVRENAEIWAQINEGGNPPRFSASGKWRDGPSGSSRRNVRLGDIDGDGRLDYCVINDGGDMTCWRNGGVQKDRAEYWEDMGQVWTSGDKGLGAFNIDDLRLVDINGDFKADALWVDQRGWTRTWINNRGVSQSLRPFWVSAGVTHAGRGRDVGRENIIFGRIFSDRHTDYLHHEENGDMLAWKSTGSGGTFLKGDGAFWGDMTGTKVDDYIFINKDGEVIVFANGNEAPDTSKYENGAAWNDKGVVLRTGMNIKALHIGDWNKDGKADVIGVDKRTGALTVWLTSYDGNTFSFEKKESGGEYCKEGWGVGRYDIAAHFADLTGNGCVDYICLDQSGRASAWLNNCDGGFNLENVGQVKAPIPQKDRANFRFADINGDKKADYLWVSKFTGDTDAWVNEGRREESDREELLGSIFKWESKGTVYSGSSRGPNIHFPNLGGVGRADIVHINPTSGHGWVSFNSCPAGGDDGGTAPRDHFLPDYFALPQCPWLTCHERALWGQGPELGCGPDPEAGTENEDDVVDECEGDDFSQQDATALAVEDKPEKVGDNTTDLVVGEVPSLIRRDRTPHTITWLFLGRVLMIQIRGIGNPSPIQLNVDTSAPPAQDLAFSLNPGCTNTGIRVVKRSSLTNQQLSNSYDTEHNPDMQFMRDLMHTFATGILPDGSATSVGQIDGDAIVLNWNANVLSPRAPRQGTTTCKRTPHRYLLYRIGSSGYRPPLVVAQRDFNQLKGRIFHINPAGQDPVRPMSDARFNSLLADSLVSTAAQNMLLEELRQVIAVFNYINHPQLLPILQQTIRDMQTAVDYIETNVPTLQGIGQAFREFIPSWYRETARLASAWMSQRLLDITERYEREIRNGNPPANAGIMQQYVRDLHGAMNNMTSPF